MTRLPAVLLAALAATLTATPALADDPAPDPFVPAAEGEPPAPTFTMTNHTYRTLTTQYNSAFGDYGFAVSAGGGVAGFTDSTARGATTDGGAWDIRAVIGVRAVIAAEVSYIGSAQPIDALGLDSSAVLLGNGLQADARLNLTTAAHWQPFLFAGIAWRHYSLSNADTNTSDVQDSDDVLEVPVGAGLAYRYKGIIVDARGEYRPTKYADLMPSLTQPGPFTTVSDASLSRWGVTATIGVEL